MQAFLLRHQTALHYRTSILQQNMQPKIKKYIFDR